MDGRPRPRTRLALVDLDAARLDRVRAVVSAHDDAADAADTDVRLVVHSDRTALPFRWAAVAGVPRAGEIAALAEMVIDVVLVADESPRADACARLGAALGARVLRLPVERP